MKNIFSADGFLGEFIGTFLLVFFGCGSVTVTVLFGAHVGLFEVAIIWGLGVMLAIYSTRHLSCAHLNPAVSIAMVLSQRMTVKKLPTYLLAQFLGAFFSACALYLLFSDSIKAFEFANHIVRGTPNSIATAMMFGEFFPNPGVKVIAVSHLNAFLAEGFGTFVLMFFILSLTEDCNLGRPNDILAPVFIGFSVSALICILAPLTQAGFNPARDLSPRIFSYFLGWGKASFPKPAISFLTVYVIAPIVGASLAGVFFSKIVEPLMNKKNKNQCGCK